ncbi:tetratricopeptide repeat protein [Flagellimonas sp. DF-77]|uniref:tetratricopeptide repeat protein n=1 Tax=Flagellimonas algarum TaxID=3230298 RepID=UPI00339788CB
MRMKAIILCGLAIVLVACNQAPTFTTQVADYEGYLQPKSATQPSPYYELWNSKIKPDSLQALALGNVAGSYTGRFAAKGDIADLKKAESALTKSLEVTHMNKAAYARALSRNYISQHRFKEALALAEKAATWGGGKTETQALLFDVHMELGQYAEAQAFLDSIDNPSNFGYLIRAAKWNDHKGDLATTIQFMEKAMAIADRSKNRSLRLWSYTNIADYYGHDGRIEASYRHYLKALELDPHNAYALKGLAWIVFSHDKNAKEALRILDAVTQTNASPDYGLLKADILEVLGDTKAVALRNRFLTVVQNEAYGVMYHGPQIDLLLDAGELNAALTMALQEVEARATPETFVLLAKTYLELGYKAKALKIIQTEVEGKTFEPVAMLTMARVYKENGGFDRVKALKQELLGALYELGPAAAETIYAL